jgi:hypothetical protein
MLNLLLLFSTVYAASPGVPFEVEYTVPYGFTCGELAPDSSFAVLEADSSGNFTIVPLLFRDTLNLPVLTAWNNKGDTLIVQPPFVSVTGAFPDTLMAPSFPPFPCAMNIPPGLPEDYARNLSFWLVWGKPPEFPWVWVIAGTIAVAALVFFIIKRRKKGIPLQNEPQTSIPDGKAAEREALALLESASFIHGRWVELFTEIDTQLRATIAGRFGVVNKALTLNQISRSLASTADGRKFLEEASPLIREITLQLYADWGSSHERASGFIKRLAKLRGEWSK